MRPVRAARAPARPSLLRRWRQRFRSHLRSVFARGDFGSLLITLGLVITTALAVQAGEWTDHLNTLAYVSAISVVLGFLLARSHYSELLALVMSSVYALGFVLLINAYTHTTSGTAFERAAALREQMSTWVNQALAGQQPANDNVAFVVFLSVLFWFVGHNAAWHVFRVDRVWRVILPTGLVLVSNQFYYQGRHSLDIYLLAYMIFALLLLIRSHVESREYEWFVHRISFPPSVRRAFFRAGAVLALVLVAAAWAAPTGRDTQSLDRLRELLSGERFMQMADLWNRLFSSLEGEGIATADYYGGDELQLGGAIQLGDQPVMYVAAPNDGARYYWRSTTFDSYDFGANRWRHVRTVRAFTDEPGLRLNVGADAARREVEQTFSMLIRASKLVYAAPQPVVLGLPVSAELDCVEDFGRNCVNESRPSDVAIISARKPLRRGDEYSVVSSLSTADASMLRGAGRAYPGWVTSLYLQGAESVPARVRQLAMEIVVGTGAQTPYDQAKAIEHWLRANITYNEAIPAPPAGVDPVEWFLFTEREGYCNYYATAMVLMLRSQGIPARLSAGFAQGAWDDARGAFLVRERDAHTWVEAYFPGYGWIEFEPTADELPISLPGDVDLSQVQPPLTPPPSPTPLPTATPTQLPPTQPGDLLTPTAQAAAPLAPSSPTPTPSPVPTSTPIPPPETTRVDHDSASGILSLVLKTLALFVLVVIGLIVLAALVIWYVEYRGLGGLNVVQRAYARLAIYGRWLGLCFAESATPDERRRYLVGELPEGEEPINAITQAYMEDRYARRDPESSLNSAARASEAWEDVRWTFVRRKIARWFGRGGADGG